MAENRGGEGEGEEEGEVTYVLMEGHGVHSLRELGLFSLSHVHYRLWSNIFYFNLIGCCSVLNFPAQITTNKSYLVDLNGVTSSVCDVFGSDFKCIHGCARRDECLRRLVYVVNKQ